ncbi:MAG: hypothetical protein AB7O96_00995 [Pseudobdellovibrionaceae bacterium]
MKTLSDFLMELEAPEGYFCFPPPIGADGVREKGIVKIEQLKNSKKIKAATIIRLLAGAGVR